MKGIDYSREWNLIQQSGNSLRAHAIERLLNLSKLHPESVVIENYLGSVDSVKAKTLSECWIKSLMTEDIIEYIERIEKWSADQQKVEQLYIEMPDEIKKTLKKLSE
jgi:hypothetical protein